MSSENTSLNQIVVDTADISANPVEFILVTLLQTKLSNPNFITEIKLDEQSLKIISLVINLCPDVINQMGVHIKKIVSDNVINSKDIPEILLLLSDVLNTNSTQLNKIKVTREQIINLIKNIFVILIESNTIKTGSDTDKQVCLALLDLSVKLLESKVNIQKVIRCKFF